MFDKFLSKSTKPQAVDDATARKPFPEHDGDQYFAGDAGRVQRLNLLAHLVPYGGVLLVLGESGVGKTALLRQLLMRASDSCRICQLSANACIDPRQALHEMLECFAWQADADRSLGGAQLRILREHLGILRRNGYAPVLVIDDADALSDTVFGVLEQLFDGDSADLLTLVLAGEATLKKRLASPLLQPLNAHVTHEIELSPFSAEEQADYIRQHMEWAGIDGMGPFQPSALKFIYVASRGVPQRINELARVFWANKKPEGDAAQNTHSWLRAPWLRQLRYILPVVAISLTAAIFHEEIRTRLFPAPVPSLADKTAETGSLVAENDEQHVEQLAQSPLVQPPPLASASTRRQSIMQEKMDTAIVAAAADKPVSLSGPDPVIVSTPETMPIVSSAKIEGPASSVAVPGHPVDIAATNTSASLTAKADSDEKVSPELSGREANGAAEAPPISGNETAKTLAETEPRRQDVTEAAVKAVANNVAGARVAERAGGKPAAAAASERDDNWWLAQPAGQYAVQLLAMEDRVVKAYIERYKLAGRVATFHVRGGKQALLAAAMGPFVTQAEASAAAQQLQQRLSGVKPWVRTVGSIHEAVASYRSQQSPDWLARVYQHEQQLLQEPPQHFAVQLMAMDQEAVTGFVTKNGLADQVVYFRTRSSGQELYAALLGSFPSRQQALAAGHELSRQTKGVRPWVRSLASVQQVIRSNHDHPR